MRKYIYSMYCIYWYHKFTTSVYKMNHLSVSTYINIVLSDIKHCIYVLLEIKK